LKGKGEEKDVRREREKYLGKVEELFIKLVDEGEGNIS